MDLEKAQMLHIAYQNIISDEKEEKERILSKGGDITQISEKIEYHLQKMALLEMQINQLNSKNLRFSVEFMEWEYGVRNRSVQVHFVTTSEAYKEYGRYVTGTVLFDEGNIENLIKRYKEKQHNDGTILFKETVSSEMSKEVKERLQKVGFKASEIDRIY